MTTKEAVETLNFYRGRGVAKDALNYPDTSKGAVDEAIDALILEVAGELARKKLDFVIDSSSLPADHPDAITPPAPTPLVKDRLFTPVMVTVTEPSSLVIK